MRLPSLSTDDGAVMLILSRRMGQSLQIAENIKVTVLAVRGYSVSVGIEAPRSVPVHRSEVHARIQVEVATDTEPRSKDSL